VDKNNWNLFLYYSIILWISALVIFPFLFYVLAFITRKIARINELTTKQLFINIINSLIPLGLMIWVAFIIPMLLNNFTFILQSLSDPFGWGWNWFGFAGIPWKPLIPEAVPWIQVLLIIAGVLMSIANLSRNLDSELPGIRSAASVRIIGTFFLGIGAGMILFYTHF